MKIAVDKNSYHVAKNDGNEYIYLYEDEMLQDLMKTKLHCIKYTECEFVDINTTDYNVDCFKKCKITDKDWDKLPEKINYKLGIIVPNCNYEHTIKKCLNSILKQTYTNYEIIIVDDCSTDNSLKIEREFAATYPRIKLVELKQKRLNGGARNEGYLHLSDDVDYIYYIDSDDWLYDENCFEEINNKLQTKPDVLFVGIADYKRGKTRKCFTPNYKNRYDAFQGWSGSCGKVIKKSLATRQECLYPEGTLKEDRNQHRKICFYMNNFELLKKPIYVWNKENYKSTTTVRENITWGTSTIRHYADTLQFALTIQGQDVLFDSLMEKIVEDCKNEMLDGGDRQW